MKHQFLFFLIAGVLLGLAGCGTKDIEPEEMRNVLDGAVYEKDR